MNTSALWAKKAKEAEEGLYWLPLDAHLIDTAEVASRLWHKWLSDSIRQAVANSINGSVEEAERLFIFLAAAHDIGKATPVFQAKCSFPATDLDKEIYDRLLMNGFSIRESREKYDFYSKTPHALASQLLLENAKDLGLSDTNLCRNAAVVLGAHHGKPPDTGYSEVLGAYGSNFGCSEDAWIHAQSELIQLALKNGNYKTLAEVPSPLMPGQVLLSGLLIMADWIASDSNKFSLVSTDCQQNIDSSERARAAWSKLNLSKAWDPWMWNPCSTSFDDGLYAARFDYNPNAMQKTALQAAVEASKPGIMIIEAPMGLGKTEAALVVAEVFRNATGSGGVFFALPTQATSDGIFPRLIKWMDNFDDGEKHSFSLAHGKAQFNKDYAELRLFEGSSEVSDSHDDNSEHTAFVHQWFNGRKKTMLADFVAGTIDQLLLLALKQKHVMLRHLGVAGKVVIIDECHAYDAYMSQYLKRALRWLGNYGVPVIILSATLPVETRREMVGAYLGNEDITGDWAQSRAYPLITYSDGDNVKSRVVESEGGSRVVAVSRLAREEVVNKLKDILSDGGCAGILMDTVQRAQDMAQALRIQFGANVVRLIHSRFIATERLEIERKLRETLGRDGQRPDKLIVVGTQVLEQSLDIDFDVMITDIAPMDLLLQRMGRLHRHDRSRPEKLGNPVCFVMGIDGDTFERGIDSVYHKHLLIRTRDLLETLNGVISLPEDIANLVNDTYDKHVEQTEEKNEWEAKLACKVSRAKAFCMRAPSQNARTSLVNWLNTEVLDDLSGKKGEAAVRDTNESVEVLIVKRNANQFSLIDGTSVPNGELSAGLARKIATQSVNLPPALCYPNIVDRTIKELETRTARYVAPWLESPWLKDELFLILDNNHSASLCGYKLTYTTEDGLVFVREDGGGGAGA